MANAIIVTAFRNAMTKRSYFPIIGQASMIDTRHLVVAKIVGERTRTMLLGVTRFRVVLR